MRSIEQRGRPGCAKVGVRTVKPPKAGTQGQPPALEHSFAWRLPFPGRSLPPCTWPSFPYQLPLGPLGCPQDTEKEQNHQ